MAMTPEPEDEEVEDVDVPPEAYALLAAATQDLRAYDDARWVEVSDRILTAALTASRRSLPVRAQSSGGAGSGAVRVSSQVIVSYLHAALDQAFPGVAVAGIEILIGGREEFDGVLIDLVVRFGTEILPVADEVRAITAGVVGGILGVEPGLVTVTTRVHVGDVTREDPHFVDPGAVEPGFVEPRSVDPGTG